MDDLEEIITEFLVESSENLDALDRDLVALEHDPGSRQLLGSIFRTIHTIKGTSGFLAFGVLEQLAHVGETLLARLRDGELTMTPPVADALLHLVDAVRALLAGIEATGADTGIDVTDARERVQAVLDGRAGGPPAPPAPPAPSAAAPVREAAPPPVVAAAPAPRRAGADATVRVDVDLLDRLMRLAGELVLTRNQALTQAAFVGNPDVLRTAQRLNVIATELQEGVMKTRMQPMEHIWSKFPRVVRDLGVQCGKTVTLDLLGSETELDRTLLEAVKDPLTHLLRNAVDHGIETPGDRIAAGKPASGTVRLRAFHQGGQVVIEISDDGGGIDPAKVGASALAKGIVTADQLAAMSDTDRLQLIFRPGLSTAPAVTNVSGRGVGMDVVRTNIENIGGAIEIESDPGLGTTCRLRIPLTLAIVLALTVAAAGQIYAIPQASLLELVALEADGAAVETVGDAEVYRLRGQLLPLVRLDQVLGQPAPANQPAVVAVLESDGRRFGLVIDDVMATEEIVVKPLGALLKGVDALGVFSGATIIGDGRVALILDVQTIARRALRDTTAHRPSVAAPPAQSRRSDTDRMLLVGIGGHRRVAIPLTSVTRLEEIRADEVERVGQREVVRRDTAILPLVRLDELLGAAPTERPDLLPIVVHTSAGRSVAMAVHEIIDIVDSDPASSTEITDTGLLGSLVVKDRVTELLDVRTALLAAEPLLPPAEPLLPPAEPLLPPAEPAMAVLR
jgi:two-component system chemotaxis sensor kinase CheA